jgi:chromosome segregation ATPase
MIKKLVLLGVGVLVLGGIVANTNLGSYVGTSYRRAATTVEESVPLEFQIDRARNMVRDLEPEIRRSMHVIAKEEVQVAELDRRLEHAEANAQKDKSEIIRLQSDLKSGDRVFRYAGHSYSADQVKEDLSRRFNRYRSVDSTIESMRKMRDARQRNLDAAREKLTAMMSAQRQLQVDVENLEAKLKLVQVAEASSDFQFDDSQLARAKQLMTDIRTRLDVAAKLANADTNFQQEIPLDKAESDDVTHQVAEYFGLDRDEKADAVAQAETPVQTASYAD